MEFDKFSKVELVCPSCSQKIITTLYEFTIALRYGHYVVKCYGCNSEYRLLYKLIPNQQSEHT